MNASQSHIVSLSFEGAAPVEALRELVKKHGGEQVCVKSVQAARLDPAPAIQFERTRRGLDRKTMIERPILSSDVEISRQGTFDGRPTQVVAFRLPDSSGLHGLKTAVLSNADMNRQLCSMPSWPLPEAKRDRILAL